MKLTGLMIGSENPKALGEFYTKLFGAAGWQQDDWYGFDIGGGTLMVGPHSEVKGSNQSPARIMITLVSEDVVAEAERFKGLGAVVIAEPYHPDPKDESIWLATFADPENNYLQLSSPWES